MSGLQDDNLYFKNYAFNPLWFSTVEKCQCRFRTDEKYFKSATNFEIVLLDLLYFYNCVGDLNNECGVLDYVVKYGPRINKLLKALEVVDTTNTKLVHRRLQHLLKYINSQGQIDIKYLTPDPDFAFKQDVIDDFSKAQKELFKLLDQLALDVECFVANKLYG